MACRKMNEDVAYARNTESGCKTIGVNKTRSCAFKTKIKVLASLQVTLNFFFYFSKKMGWPGDGKQNILWGWPKMIDSNDT